MNALSPTHILLQNVRRSFLRGFGFAAIVSFFLNFSILISPIFMLQVYQRVIPTKSYDTLYGLIVIGVVGIIIFGLLDFTRNWAYSVMAQGLAQRVNMPALQAGVLKSIEGGATAGGGVMRDITELRRFIGGHSISTPLDALWSIVFIAALLLIHPVYAIVAIGFIVFMLVLNFITDVLTRPAINAANEAQFKHAQEVAGSLRYAEVIEAMGMLPALASQWRRSEAIMLSYSDAADMRARMILALSKSVQKGLQMATVATGAFLVLAGEISSGVLFAGMVLTSQAVAPYSNMIESWREWVDAAAAWGRIRDLLESRDMRRQTMPAPVSDGDLVVENLAYVPDGREIPVLRGISFTLSPGEVLGIAGPSGAGKSTLARCLTGIIKPTVGGVYLDGHSTYLWERESFGKAVGYLPQAISLLDGTIRQSISRMQEGDPRDVIRAAQQAGIHDLIGRLPHGYDTPVRDGQHFLSGGQLQRLALARALYGEPKLLILDEPNSNLDTAGEQALIAAIEMARARGAIVIMIAHRPSVMAVADKLMVIENGVLKQFGPKTEVISMISPDARAKISDDKRRRAPRGRGET